RFIEWGKDSPDVGTLTRRALIQAEYYGMAPLDAGRTAGEEAGRFGAGNGGLMRTAPVSLFFFNDTAGLLKASADICRITHWDHRCVLSCRAHNVLLWGLLKGKSPEEAYSLMCDSLEEGFNDEGFEQAVTDGREYRIGELTLDGYNKGYTYLGLTVAISALMNYGDFETPIVEIVNKGGDADTNACIAGSLLGALYGGEGIPSRWLEGLCGYSYLAGIADRLYERASEK
ncbi:MAG: ADP-ribosylglycohydrolase family protein, partial [Abditibacteriota bacterium]|nr:ADP-ribosylglycohydrolase family protein [Abditibacteriota bacterium]